MCIKAHMDEDIFLWAFGWGMMKMDQEDSRSAFLPAGEAVCASLKVPVTWDAHHASLFLSCRLLLLAHATLSRQNPVLIFGVTSYSCVCL